MAKSSHNNEALGSPPVRTRSGFQLIRARMDDALDRWLTRRLPPQSAVRLGHRRLFILPSYSGLGFVLVAVLIWLLGTNYQNNLAILLSFWMLSLFAVSIFFTYANLSGIDIAHCRSDPVFCGDRTAVEITFFSRRRPRYALMAFWPKSQPIALSLTPGKTEFTTLFVPTHQRGWSRLSRLCIETRFPLGMLRCWSWVDLDVSVLVYPAPKSIGPLPPKATVASENSRSMEKGPDDFYGFQKYQRGDSLRHIGWKQYARGQGLLTKQFHAGSDTALWLEWDFLAGMPTESRLSVLTDWVVKAEAAGQRYGLRLPNGEWRPSRGKDHYRQLLHALAVFPEAPTVTHSRSPQEVVRS